MNTIHKKITGEQAIAIKNTIRILGTIQEWQLNLDEELATQHSFNPPHFGIIHGNIAGWCVMGNFSLDKIGKPWLCPAEIIAKWLMGLWEKDAKRLFQPNDKIASIHAENIASVTKVTRYRAIRALTHYLATREVTWDNTILEKYEAAHTLSAQ